MFKIIRIARDLAEFILLSIGFVIGTKYYLHNFIGAICVLAYSGAFIINMISQIYITTQTKNSQTDNIPKRIKTFIIILIIPTIIVAIIFLRDDIRYSLFILLILGIIWLCYYLLIHILFKIVYFLESTSFKNWISYKINKFVLLVSILLILGYITIKLLLLLQNYNHNITWQQAIGSNKIEAYSDYITQYPKGKHIEEAIWRQAEKINTMNSYLDYIVKYPNGEYVEDVAFHKTKLQKTNESRESYLNKYPYGKYAEEVTFEIARLQKTKETIECYLNKYPKGKYANSLQLLTECKCDSFIDKRDGRIYRTVKIGKTVWMAENLKFKSQNSSSYGDSIENENKYGRLYTWEDASNVCPQGWKLPDDSDWQQLLDLVGDNLNSLKSTTGWNETGTDMFGFSALPAGYCDDYIKYTCIENNLKAYHHFSFSSLGEEAVWWANTYIENSDKKGIWKIDLYSNLYQTSPDTDSRYSIRCIKTEPSKARK